MTINYDYSPSITPIGLIVYGQNLKVLTTGTELPRHGPLKP